MALNWEKCWFESKQSCQRTLVCIGILIWIFFSHHKHTVLVLHAFFNLGFTVIITYVSTLSMWLETKIRKTCYSKLIRNCSMLKLYLIWTMDLWYGYFTISHSVLVSKMMQVGVIEEHKFSPCSPTGTPGLHNVYLNMWVSICWHWRRVNCVESDKLTYFFSDLIWEMY